APLITPPCSSVTWPRNVPGACCPAVNAVAQTSARLTQRTRPIFSNKPIFRSSISSAQFSPVLLKRERRHRSRAGRATAATMGDCLRLSNTEIQNAGRQTCAQVDGATRGARSLHSGQNRVYSANERDSSQPRWVVAYRARDSNYITGLYICQRERWHS